MVGAFLYGLRSRKQVKNSGGGLGGVVLQDDDFIPFSNAFELFLASSSNLLRRPGTGGDKACAWRRRSVDGTIWPYLSRTGGPINMFSPSGIRRTGNRENFFNSPGSGGRYGCLPNSRDQPISYWESSSPFFLGQLPSSPDGY